MSFLGLMTVRAHEAVVADVRKQRDDETKRANGLSAELAALKAKRDQQTRNLKQFRTTA